MTLPLVREDPRLQDQKGLQPADRAARRQSLPKVMVTFHRRGKQAYLLYGVLGSRGEHKAKLTWLPDPDRLLADADGAVVQLADALR
jgi:hypothetical protein